VDIPKYLDGDMHVGQCISGGKLNPVKQSYEASPMLCFKVKVETMKCGFFVFGFYLLRTAAES